VPSGKLLLLFSVWFQEYSKNGGRELCQSAGTRQSTMCHISYERYKAVIFSDSWVECLVSRRQVFTFVTKVFLVFQKQLKLKIMCRITLSTFVNINSRFFFKVAQNFLEVRNSKLYKLTEVKTLDPERKLCMFTTIKPNSTEDS
jgi:hypothetical protein